MLISERVVGLNNSDVFRRAREANKKRKNSDLKVTLNDSLNESIKSFEKIYKAEGQDIYGDLASKESHIFEETSSPLRTMQERRLSSFSALKKKDELVASCKVSKHKNDFSTNSSMYGDKKNSSFCGQTPKTNPVLATKRDSVKATLKNLTSYMPKYLKEAQLKVPSSAQLKPRFFAYRETKSSVIKTKALKNTMSPKASAEKISALAGKYEALDAKLAEITKLVDVLTFETHFVLPELIGDSDKFREAMTGALGQMQSLVQARTKTITSMKSEARHAPRTDTTLK